MHRALVRLAPRRVIASATCRRCLSTELALHEPVTSVSEDESMMRDAAAHFAANEIMPRVEAMDETSKMDQDLINGLFEAGFMGVEIDEQYGGSGSSFTAALLVIEELAKDDPAVSVMVDIHNTIVNNCVTNWASEDLKSQWLPRLGTDTLARSLSLRLAPAPMPLPSRQRPGRTAATTSSRAKSCGSATRRRRGSSS